MKKALVLCAFKLLFFKDRKRVQGVSNMLGKTRFLFVLFKRTLAE